jgi:2-keto-4-pentenoate hydratase/2-oxohepta-3-ene-1,7-dioic acid hydratase in catechol pathway
MSISIVRHMEPDGMFAWAVLEAGLARPLPVRFETTAALIEHGLPALRERTMPLGPARPLDPGSIVSPVTHPCRIIAQATNYRDHAREVGLDGERPSNIFFRKSSASLSDPSGAIVRPPHVRLLDYEIELGLVIGSHVRGPTTITENNLAEYVGALVLTNDVSARDVQVPEGQFYKGKSYRTFTPCGPVLFVPERGELQRWPELRLRLEVNGQLRQSARCADMVHGPAETLSELSTFEDLDPGDLILTGTPGGVALSPPPRWMQSLIGLLPERTKWRLFVEAQSKRREYLANGDRVTATIRTDDGALDLGAHDLVVEAGR